MNAAKSAQHQHINKPDLPVRLSAASAITLLSFLLYRGYRSDFAAFLKISNSLSATLCTLFALALFIEQKRLISTLFFQEACFGLQTSHADQEQPSHSHNAHQTRPPGSNRNAGLF